MADFLFPDEHLKEKEDVKLKPPAKFQIVLHNDNYTTMDFVIEVLMAVFHKTLEEATLKMQEVHKKGQSLVGIYTREIAESKILQAQKMAEENGFPLKVTMERML